jgi:hypothetical protein
MSRAESLANGNAKVTALDSAALDGVLAELRGIAQLTGLDRTLAIGELILTRFYDGSVPAWRERKRNKSNSIRRLAARADCPFSKSALNDAVAIFVMVEHLPSVRTLRHVGASHLASVLVLSAAQADATLAQAEAERWSVRRLKQHVAKLQELSQPESRAAREAAPSASAVLRHRFEQLALAVEAAGEARQTDAALAATTDWLAEELSDLAVRVRAIFARPGVAEASWRPRVDRSA